MVGYIVYLDLNGNKKRKYFMTRASDWPVIEQMKTVNNG
jgi:hypothetical protein